MSQKRKAVKNYVENFQFISREHREAMDKAPQVDGRNRKVNPPLFEKETLAKTYYENEQKNRTAARLQGIYDEINEGKEELKSEIHKKKYPLDSYSSSELKLRALQTKIRAEGIALQKLNWNTMNKFLEKEIRNGDTDFLMSFKDAMSLNDSIPSEIREEISSKLTEFEKGIGLPELNKEAEAFDKLLEMGEAYKGMLHDHNDPLWKLETGSIASSLTGEV